MWERREEGVGAETELLSRQWAASQRAYENAFKKPESARSKTENANAKRITERGVALVWFRVGTKVASALPGLANPLWNGQVTPFPPRARP